MPQKPFLLRMKFLLLIFTAGKRLLSQVIQTQTYKTLFFEALTLQICSHQDSKYLFLKKR